MLNPDKEIEKDRMGIKIQEKLRMNWNYVLSTS